jgi:hypothetical protein
MAALVECCLILCEEELLIVKVDLKFKDDYVSFCYQIRPYFIDSEIGLVSSFPLPS